MNLSETTAMLTNGSITPDKYGATLEINPFRLELGDRPIAIDVETDEEDGFVGAAICKSPTEISYFTRIGSVQKIFDEKTVPLVGHNLKGDLKWLKSWGVNVSEKNLYYDTMIASYVTCPTKESHGLKTLAKEKINMEWPTYRDIVGKGRKKITLDKQPLDVVANYCGLDCLATYRLYQFFNLHMTPHQRRVYQTIEMPINRLLYRVEEIGVKVDVQLLDELNTRFQSEIEEIEETIHRMTEKEIQDILETCFPEKFKEKWEISGFKAFEKNRRFNPGSWQQKRLLLRYMGIEVKSTNKNILVKYKEHEIIGLLLEYSQLAKLRNSFITAFKNLPTLPTVHSTYNQVSESSTDKDTMRGIRTGRLSSKGPNLQQIPARSERGKLLRKMFVPRDGKTFVVSDYSQIELRLAAHFSRDPILTQAFLNGEDVHSYTAKSLGVDRSLGKTGNFLLAFGGSHWRLMESLNVDEKAAKDFYNLYWKKFTVLRTWKESAVRQAGRMKGVQTLAGRWIPIEGLDSTNYRERGRAERFAISGIIQGSAADILKRAMLACDEAGFTPCLTVHDELVFETLKETVSYSVDKIKELMEGVEKLRVPLEVEIGHGLNWGEAKN